MTPSVTAAPIVEAYPWTPQPGTIEAMILAAFPDAPFMLEIARRESVNFRDDVVYGPTWSRTSDCGAFQTNIIHAGRYAAHGWDIYVDCFVPERNIQIAREIYDDQGPSAWTTY